MADRENGELLRHLLLSFPDPEIGGGTRVLDSLVEGSIAACCSVGKSARLLLVSDLTSHIRTAVRLTFEPSELQGSLERLEARGWLEFGNRERTAFRYDENRLGKLRNKLDGRRGRDARVRREWVAAVMARHKLTSQEGERLWEALSAFIGRMVYAHAAEAAAFLYMTDDLGQVRFFNMLDTKLPTVAELLADGLAGVAAVEFKAFFRSEEPDTVAYISDRVEVAFFYHLIAIDPAASELLREAIEDKVLYLDTNFLYRLLGLDGPAHAQLPTALVKTAEQLGFTLLVARETVNEFVRSLRSDIQRVEARGLLTREVYREIVAEQNDQDADFIAAFYRQLTSGQVATLQEFLRKYENVPVLIKEWGINIDEKAALDDEWISSREFQAAFEELDTWHERKKPEGSIEHDVLLWLHVRRLRGAVDGTPRQTKFWLLTYDRRLTRFAATYATKEQLPFCILASDWVQITRPFLPRTYDYEASFVALLDHPGLTHGEGSVPVQHMIESLARLERFETLPKRLVAAMVTDGEFDRRFRQATTPEAEQQVVEHALRQVAAKVSRENEELRDQLQLVLERVEDLEQSDAKRSQALADVTADRDRTRRELESERERAAGLQGERTRQEGLAKKETDELRQAIDSLRSDQRQTRRWLVFAGLAAMILPIGVALIAVGWPGLSGSQRILSVIVLAAAVLGLLGIPLGKRWLAILGGILAVLEFGFLILDHW